MDSLLKQLIITYPNTKDIIKEMMVGQKFTLEQLKAHCEKKETEEAEKVHNIHFITLFFL